MIIAIFYILVSLIFIGYPIFIGIILWQERQIKKEKKVAEQKRLAISKKYLSDPRIIEALKNIKTPSYNSY